MMCSARLGTLSVVAGGAIAAAALGQEARINCGSNMTEADNVAFQALFDEGIYDPPTAAALPGNFEVPITFHVVRRTNGTGGIAQSRIDQAVTNLNLYFADAGLAFCQMGDTQFIDSDAFYFDIDTQAEIDALRSMNQVPNTINVYCTANLAFEDFDLCGISSFTWSGVQGIAMWNDCFGLAGDRRFTHEVGHYFNLMHTHEVSCCNCLLGTCDECTSGSNCDCCGDRVCDTPADPQLYDPYNDVYVVDNACNYTGGGSGPCVNDPPYDPDTTNIMSYTRNHCRDAFTPGQNDRMVATLVNKRAGLITADCAYSGVCGAGAGDCAEPHGGVGCLDAACCTEVCDVDPSCCDTAWDQGCADLAANLCGLDPVNDECADAIPIIGLSEPFSTIYADTDGPEHPECAGGGNDQVNNDVWFTYTAPCSAYVTFSTCDDADFDTKIAVYNHNSCPPNFIDLMGCNDDGTGCGNGTSKVTVFAQQDQDLLVRVGGAGDAEGSGVISVDCTALWNDCEEPLVLFEFIGSVFLDTNFADTDGPAGFCGAQNDVWIDYYPPCTGIVNVTTCNAANFDTRLCVYDTCACPVTNADLIASGTCSTGFWGEQGQCYKVRLGGANGETGSAQVTFSCDAAPSNNPCEDAIAVESGDVVDFDIDIATTDGPMHDPPCTTGAFDCSGGKDLQITRDIWYTFTAPCDATLTLSTCNAADFDTRLAVYGTCQCPVTDADLLACNDDAGGCGQTSELSVAVTEDECYLIRLGAPLCDFQGTTGQLSVSLEPDCQGDGDLNGDGVINVIDLLALLAAWGPCPAPPLECPADLDGDGQVGITDLLLQLSNWT